MLALAAGGVGGAITPTIAVAAVVLVGSGVSYLALTRRDGTATFGGAVFNWSVVVLTVFAALLFLLT